jgi:5-methylcytosine-specific restriction endonuclease McrA
MSIVEIAEMTIDQKMSVAVQEIIDTYGVGHIATRAELKEFIQGKYNIANGSIIPSDYCYNRINDGITLSKPTLFEYLGRNSYRCLGEKYPYNGEVYHKELIAGTCRNGKREIFGMPVETIEKTKRKKVKSRDPSPRLRFEVLARDKFTCRFCGASPMKDPSVTLHIDHIIPWSKGGETSLTNLQTLCAKCNLGKSDLMVDISAN